MVEIYRGRRGSGRSVKVATVRNGTAHTVTDPSFYGDLGVGAHKLVFTLKLSAGSPQHAGLEGRSGEVGLNVVSRLKVAGRPDLSSN